MSDIHIHITDDTGAPELHTLTPDQIVVFIKTVRSYIELAKNFVILFPNNEVASKVIDGILRLLDTIMPFVGEPWFAKMIEFFYNLFLKHDKQDEVVRMLKVAFS